MSRPISDIFHDDIFHIPIPLRSSRSPTRLPTTAITVFLIVHFSISHRSPPSRHGMSLRRDSSSVWCLYLHRPILDKTSLPCSLYQFQILVFFSFFSFFFSKWTPPQLLRCHCLFPIQDRRWQPCPNPNRLRPQFQNLESKRRSPRTEIFLYLPNHDG